MGYVLSLLKQQYNSVLLSGHSLGGAMANLYLNEHKNTDRVEYECYTFGVPSGKHINQEEIDAGYEIATQRVKGKWQQSKIFFRWLESYWNSLQKTKLEQVIEDYFSKVQSNLAQRNSLAI